MPGLRTARSATRAGTRRWAGNEHSGAHCTPGLWVLLDRIGRDCWPALLRGDCGIASEGVMREAEQGGIDYLFKLRLTKNVKRLIERTFAKGGWRDAGQGWQGKEETLRLVGWSRQRRVVVLRRKLKDGVVASARDNQDQLQSALRRSAPTPSCTNTLCSSPRSRRKCSPSRSFIAIGQIARTYLTN
jgi:hypothetical protein